MSENSSLILTFILIAKLDFNSCASKIKGQIQYLLYHAFNRCDVSKENTYCRRGFDLEKKKKKMQEMHNSSFLVQRGSVLRHKSAPIIPILTRSKSSVVKLLSTSHFHTNNVEREETSVLFWRFSYSASEERQWKWWDPSKLPLKCNEKVLLLVCLFISRNEKKNLLSFV